MRVSEIEKQYKSNNRKEFLFIAVIFILTIGFGLAYLLIVYAKNPDKLTIKDNEITKDNVLEKLDEISESYEFKSEKEVQEQLIKKYREYVQTKEFLKDSNILNIMDTLASKDIYEVNWNIYNEVIYHDNMMSILYTFGDNKTSFYVSITYDGNCISKYEIYQLNV